MKLRNSMSFLFGSAAQKAGFPGEKKFSGDPDFTGVGCAPLRIFLSLLLSEKAVEMGGAGWMW